MLPGKSKNKNRHKMIPEKSKKKIGKCVSNCTYQ